MEAQLTTAPGGDDDVPVDFRFFVRVVLRRRWMILTIAAAVLAMTAVYTLRQPKIYASAATVIIDSTAPKFLDNSQVQDVVDMGQGSVWYQKEYYETQYKVIMSRSVAQRVVDKLGLQSDATFLHLSQIHDPDKRHEAMQKKDAVAVLQEKIQVQPVKDSRVVGILVEDEDPKFAALLANEVANAYIAESLSLKSSVTESASKWLEDRLASLETQSKASDLAMYDFKKQADMLTVSLEDRESMVSQRLVAINGALTEVRLKIAGLRARVDAMNELRRASADRKDLIHWAEALPSSELSVVNELKVRYAGQLTECAELQGRYLAGHPKLVACNEKLDSIRKELVRELENEASENEIQLNEAVKKEQNLSKLLEQSKAEGFEVNKKQIEFERIKREADNNQRLYDVVLKRLKDIELSGLLRTSNVRVLDAALPSVIPVRPKVKNSLVLGLVLGLLLGFGVGVGLEQLDNTVKNQEDVEARLKLPFLGFVPRIPDEILDKSDRDLYVFKEPKTAVAESCRAVRTNLLFMSPDKPFRTMLITSTAPREGKSTSAINMSIAMAQSGSRVLLLDTDMRRPRLHKAFGVSNEVGISSVVVGSATPEEAIKNTEVPNLFVMPCGPIPPNPAELLHTQAFRDVLRTVTERFDRVILDSPPINAVADALVLATQVDGVMVVFNAGKTQRSAATRAVRGLIGVKARVFGAILNEVERAESPYADYYYQFRSYGYDYADKPERAV